MFKDSVHGTVKAFPSADKTAGYPILAQLLSRLSGVSSDCCVSFVRSASGVRVSPPSSRDSTRAMGFQSLSDLFTARRQTEPSARGKLASSQKWLRQGSSYSARAGAARQLRISSEAAAFLFLLHFLLHFILVLPFPGFCVVLL